MSGSDGSQDSFEGGNGFDRILGGAGDDVIRVSSYTGTNTVERIDGGGGINTIAGTGGNDLIDLSATEVLNIASLDGGAGADTLIGWLGDDFILGGAGSDTLEGNAGDDLIQGGTDADVLRGGAGRSLLDGRTGNDTLYGDTGNDWLAGGVGNDTLVSGGGSDSVAFNRGEGQDLLTLSGATQLTLSLGGGIAYADLMLRKVGGDLVLETGTAESLSVSGWYATGAVNPQAMTLQVITEAMPGYNPAGSDPLTNRKVQRFDFKALIATFDQARSADPTLDRWGVMNHLLDAHLAGADDAALGGDLSYRYGLDGALANMGLSVAQDTLKHSAFGVQAQTLRPIEQVQTGAVRLG